MRKISFALLISTSLLLFSTAHAREIRGPDGRVWRESIKPPDEVFQEFISLPETNVGHVDILLKRDRPRDGMVMVRADLRGQIVIFSFEGVPGGAGFAIPRGWPYRFRDYILEIRWQDARTQNWYFWWNSQKLDDTLLERPTLYPQAVNAPF